MSRLAILLLISLFAFPMLGNGFEKFELPRDFPLEQIEIPQFSHADDGLVIGGRESSVSFAAGGNQKVSNTVIFPFTQKFSLLSSTKNFSIYFNFSIPFVLIRDVLIFLGILRI